MQFTIKQQPVERKGLLRSENGVTRLEGILVKQLSDCLVDDQLTTVIVAQTSGPQTAQCRQN